MRAAAWLMTACALMAALLSVRAAAAAADLTIAVDGSHAEHAVSPLLWGAFFEEINHAGVGGLHAELIQNPLFQDNTFAPWTSADCALALDAHAPLNAINPNALLITPPPAAGCVVTNPGFWGIGVRPFESFALSFYTRVPSGGKVVVTAGVRAKSGHVYAQTTFVAAGATFHKHTAQLIAADCHMTDGTAEFFVALPDHTPVAIHVVSLMPSEGWRGLPYIRRDLGDMVAAIHPKVLRFPGGNYVEGNDKAGMVRWKKTVGPIEERPGHPGVWGYWSPDHFGYFEGLMLAERLGAAPIYVVNCGQYFYEGIPLDQMNEFVQDALDAVEFANGPINTTYGALRAKMGHPAPFNLQYLAVGNEEYLFGQLDKYLERYPLFYTALKAAYPSLQIIANGPEVAAVSKYDMVEVHDYDPPYVYYGRYNMFDGYDRSMPVFVSEYAVAGDWVDANNKIYFYTQEAAVAEAVFMCGMERNSDFIKASAYAPLFVHANDHAWDPDAITFNSTHAYGSISYYLQTMFGSHPGLFSLATNFTTAAGAQVVGSVTARADPAHEALHVPLVFKLVNFGNTTVTTQFVVSLPSPLFHMDPITPAKAAILQAPPFAKNSFAQPRNVVPLETAALLHPQQKLGDAHLSFTYTLAPKSVHILETHIGTLF